MKILDYKSDSEILFSDLLEKVRRIGVDVLRPAANSVDREARFPQEGIDALRKEGLLSAYVPQTYGGMGLSIVELSAIAHVLGQYCANTAMIWVMHQIQVACIVHHGQSSSFFQNYLRQLVEQQSLLASITSEVGVGGDVRTSIAAVEKTDSGYTLEKRSTTLSYGEYADGFLATARRSPEAASGDQVLVLLERADTTLTLTGSWNPLGMRGTCSPAMNVSSTFNEEHIFSTSYSELSTQTMVPFSHLLWSSCWFGIATDALARARKFLQTKARQLRASSIPGDTHLVEASSQLQLMRANLHETLYEYAQMLDTMETLDDAVSDLGFTIKLNNVKVLSSQLVVQIVQQALMICGMAGYSEDSPFSVARHLRDAYSAGLMISNDRLNITNASLHLVYKER
ncbi:acyl-CoA dehydrogenase family protein [Dictyobacter arantiisoli]|uniref:Acyl-CoA dehydrogenase n=1 Tax=Dictyobacter arantiisoli TaxID=2014874 RepID=A0A5A5TA46_9CHLR|nr:acyl-CoA dehydrogenase family protein [Dictyobacter arantiisoli]GCF08026.1 acyl-CoA dehydrogenase [Dictyobacter arantiisoli]